MQKLPSKIPYWRTTRRGEKGRRRRHKQL
jgi:hypothetical protein